MFAAGQPILARTLVGGRVRFAEAAIAVMDEPDRIAFYRAAGTPMKVPTSWALGRSDPRHEELSRQEYESGTWEHHDAVWLSTNVLVVAQPDAWWSGWIFWDAETFEFLSWYVNFEVPWARSRLGFDSKDLSLDLVVTPTREVIEKDRADYDERLRRGLISATEAREVEQASAAARKAIREGRPPFDDSWIEWRPDPTWEQPHIPTDWHLV